MSSWITRLFGLVAVILLGACAAGDLEETPDPIGDFRLGFFVPSTAPEMTKGPASREATPEEWKAAMKAAFEPRFQRYAGGSFFHIGAIVDGYVLAQPGIPIVLAPKSVLIFRVTIIEDATGKQFPEEPHQITVVESVGAGTVLGSGLTSTKEEQLADLAENAARQTERWMRDQPWFGEFAGTADEGEAVDPEATDVAAQDAPENAPVDGEPLSVIALPDVEESGFTDAANADDEVSDAASEDAPSDDDATEEATEDPNASDTAESDGNTDVSDDVSAGDNNA